MTATLTEKTSAQLSQEMFEAMFVDHQPLVDVRTPADVAAQKVREGWK